MICSEIRRHKLCPFGCKAMDCYFRGPKVKPSGHTCRNIEVHNNACRAVFELEMAQSIADRGDELKFDN